jgi:hypothetical protein
MSNLFYADGTFSHNVDLGPPATVSLALIGGSLTAGEDTVYLSEITTESTGSITIGDAFNNIVTSLVVGLTYDGIQSFTPDAGNPVNLSVLTSAGITTIDYTVTISGVTGGVTTVVTGLLAPTGGSAYTAVIADAPPPSTLSVTSISPTLTPENHLTAMTVVGGFDGGETSYSMAAIGTTTDTSIVIPTLWMTFTSGQLTITPPSGEFVDLSTLLPGDTGVHFQLTYTGGATVYTGLLKLSSEELTYVLPLVEPVAPPTTATISLNYVFTPTAGQTYTYSILGEVSGEIASTETIVLDVPKSKMDTILAYSSNWFDGLSGASGTQPIPDLALILNTITGSQLDALTMGLTGATQGTSYAYSTTLGYVQGDQSSNCHSLDYQFQSISGFTYTTPGVTGESDVLASIPEEAIKSFTSSSVSTVALSGVVGDSVVIPTEGQTEEYAGLSGAIQSLFEQAVSAGLVTSTAKGVTLNSTVVTGLAGTPTLETAMGTTADVYGAQWSVGQSLGIYVQFQMQKLRTYQLATLPTFGGGTANQALEISFGGVTFSVDPTVVETSGATPVTYEIILNTIADT